MEVNVLVSQFYRISPIILRGTEVTVRRGPYGPKYKQSPKYEVCI